MKKFFSVALMILVFLAGKNFVCAEEMMAADFAQEVLYYVNIEREKVGLKGLKLSPQLMKAAEVRAEEILQYFSHTRPDGSDCFTAVKIRYNHIGENIAAGQSTPQDVVEAWMDSPGHRENILDPNFGRMGLGYVYAEDSRYGHYWAQLFMN